MEADTQNLPQFAVAESVFISEDQCNYLFTLKETLWADGHPLTAFDFENSWKERLSPTFPCEFAHDLFCIKNAKVAKMGKCSLDEVGIKAIDAHTLQIDLEHPTPYFLSALTSHSFLPTPIHITQANPKWLEEAYIGNGPFRIKEKNHSGVFLEKNPNYWGKDVVRLDGASVFYIADEQTSLAMYEHGDLDWVGFPFGSLPEEALPSLQKQGRLESYDIAGVYYYVFNTQNYPCNNANIRKALSLAINREEIVRNITLMEQPIATRFVPPGMLNNSVAYFKDADVAQAQILFAKGLQELGMTKEEFPCLHLSYNTLSGHHKIAQAIQQQWKQALGIDVSLENKEWKVFLDQLGLGQFQIARMGGVAPFDDASTMLEDFRYLNRKNTAQWQNPLFTALLERADLSLDPNERAKLLADAEKILIDEMPVAPIYFYKGSYMKKPYVKGAHISKFNELNLKHVYIEVNE
jgi:oligopeptide transport system substrate-binding protein